MSALQQALIMTATSGTQPHGNLDAYTANLWSVGGTRQLLTAYSGPLIRVRRSSDNAEQDIGIVGTALDTAAQSSFLGADDGFVKTVYDQSGLGNDFVQATTTKQPRIALAGVYDGKLVFDGTDDCLRSSNSSGTPIAAMCFITGKMRSSSGAQVICEHGTGALVGGVSSMVFYTNGGTRTVIRFNGTDYYQGNYNGDNLARHIIAAATDTTLAGVNRCVLYMDGTFFTEGSHFINGTTPSGSLSSLQWNIGARNNGASLPSALDLDSFVIYESNPSGTDVAAISAALF